MHLETPEPATGAVQAAITTGIVGVFRRRFGRGPTQAKSYLLDDIVICLLRGGFSPVEQTLTGIGREDVVHNTRSVMQEAMREELREVVESATGRTVQAFMSANHVDPDMSLETFILGPRASGEPDDDDPDAPVGDGASEAHGGKRDDHHGAADCRA